jgi:two-component system phosphate regulon sensor histidine kinase PhoR
MTKKRLLWQLYPAYLILILVALLGVTWYATTSVERFFHERAAYELEMRARLVAQSLESLTAAKDRGEIERLCKRSGKAAEMRVTVILPEGRVLGDSDADAASMENHADRPEFEDALARGDGAAVRPSPTLRIPMMYFALRARDAAGQTVVIRAAMSLAHTDNAVRRLKLRIAAAGLALAAFLTLVTYWVSRRMSRPIEEMRSGIRRLAEGDLAHRLHMPDTAELAGLAEVINEMAAQLDERVRLITAQRNEQEAVFAGMVEGVAAIDREDRILRINRAAAKILGVSPDAARGKAIQEVIRNLDLQRFVAQALSTQGPVEAEIRLRGATERCLQAHGAPLTDAAGRPIGAVIVLHDVTRLRQLEGFRRDFVANVSHELRTPVTSIKGFVETLIDGAARDPDTAAQFLKIIARQVDRLEAIIHDLLTLAGLEQGRQGGIDVAETPLAGPISAAVELCAHKAAARDIQLRVECPADLAACINAPLIEQAVANLVDNAIKYGAPGRPVQVTAAREHHSVVIAVRDEGAGIAAEHLPRVFERFYRVDKGRSRDAGGTGLGLAIVKHIALVHGGGVGVASTPGQGSVFTLTLPLAGPAPRAQGRTN